MAGALKKRRTERNRLPHRGTVIKAVGLSKSYGSVQALRDVSFDIAEGEVVGLLGPNGSGKTTLMKLLTGYLQPDFGSATIDGLDVSTKSLEAQRRTGYLPENAPLYPELSIQKYLQMIADLRGISRLDQQSRISDVVRATGLTQRLSQPIGHLSKGFRQRVGIAQAIIHKPQVLILDEPTIGLDPTQLVDVRALIRRLARHSTVLLSTHILSEVEATCSRVLVLLGGELRADARLNELSESSDVTLVLDPKAPNIVGALRSLPNVRTVQMFDTPDGSTYTIRGREHSDLRSTIYQLIRDENLPLRELHRISRTLEAVFNELATTESDSAIQAAPDR